MDYEIDELLPVMAKLADKYTSKESTSVSYETAQKLMGAILYCIHECQSQEGAALLEGVRADCRDAYEEGYRIVLDKVMQAKEIYHRVAGRFNDYGCRNYKDTIIEGMPKFFVKYDVMFEPQNHILTLDYPVLNLRQDYSGIDFILDYLKEVEYEQQFLRNFSENGIRNLLEYKCPGYQSLYFDNICEPVLMRAAACLAAERDVYDLELGGEDSKIAEEYFADEYAEQTERHLLVLLDILEKNIMEDWYRSVFKKCAHDFTVRLRNGIWF